MKIQRFTQARLIEIAEEKGIDELVSFLAALAVGVEALPLAKIMEAARTSDAMAAYMRKCKSTVEEAERGQRALEGFALQARLVGGRVLAAADPGSKGSGKKSERRLLCEEVGLTHQDAQRQVKLSELSKEQIDSIASRLEKKGKRLTVRSVLDMAKSVGGGESYGDEWYTPRDFLDAVRKAAGGRIDCDLTSCLLAQRNVMARAWYSLRSPHDKAEQEAARAAGMTAKEIEQACEAWKGLGEVKDERLTQKPAGFVFVQPPYSCPAPTIRTVLDGYKPGKGGLVKEAVILVNVATASAVQQELLGASTARLWVGKGKASKKARMSFISPTGKAAEHNRYDQVAYYVGARATTFAAALGGWGTVKIDGAR